MFLEILPNSQENTCTRVSFLIKLQASAWTFIKKEAQAQVFSFEFCEISENTFFTEHPWATASEEKRFSKLAPYKSVKTACVCIAFFFHYFEYYGQNIFSRITVLYLIAKVERKEKTFYLKHEIILCQKKREAKCFRLRR